MPINEKTFCVAPWFSVYIDSDKSLAPCCKFKKHFQDYNKIEEYFNSQELKKVRKDLLNGVQNENCVKCWNDEKNSGDSLRLISNRTIVKRSGTKIIDQIKNPKLSELASFDLTLGNLCNLKCIMCNPGLSSQLLAEANLYPQLKTRYEDTYQQSQFDWPKKNDFVDWCNHYLPQAIHIKFTGGEPFIIPWIHDVIDKISNSQKEKCVLHFTSNLTVLNDKLFECFSKFKEVWISVSVEGIQDTHEYLRYGHSWDKLSNNILYVKNKKIKNLKLKINHVVQSPSYHSIIDMTKYFDNLQIDIHPILLTSPKHFHISALTKHAKQKFIDVTQNYTGYNKEFITYVRSVSEQYMEQDSELTHDCISHLQEFDQIRHNDYQKIIPNENFFNID